MDQVLRWCYNICTSSVARARLDSELGSFLLSIDPEEFAGKIAVAYAYTIGLEATVQTVLAAC